MCNVREAPLRALELLYVGRTFTLWREMGVLRDFLERNVAAVVEQLSAPAGSDAAPSPSRLKRFEEKYECIETTVVYGRFSTFHLNTAS